MTSVAEGLTNAETGDRLYMSPATARTHVSRILTELNESGLVCPGWQ